MKLFRISALGALATAAISAHALTLSFQTEGSTAAGHGADYTEPSGTVNVISGGTVYRGGNDPLATVSGVTYNFTESTPGAALPALSTITGGTGTILGSYNGTAYTLNFTINGGAVIGDGSLSRSFAANIDSFTIIGGGVINGYTGHGKVAGTLAGGADLWTGISKSSFDLEAVPEPATLAIFGIGLVGLAARRRK